MFRRSSRLPRLAVLMLLLLSTSACEGAPPHLGGHRDRAATPAESKPPRERDDTAGGDRTNGGDRSDQGDTGNPGPAVVADCPGSITLTVAETAHRDRPDALVEAGIPLAPGAMGPHQVLEACSGDRPLPVRSRPLAYWPDGSVRWALARIPLALKSGETRKLTLAPVDGSSPPAPAVKLPAMTLKLRTDKGEFDFPVTNGQSKTVGDHFIQTWIEPLTADRVRVITHVAQLNRDSSWKDLSLEIAASGRAEADDKAGAIRMGEWTAAVYRADQRGPVKVSGQGGLMRLDLYPGDELRPYPADEGFHVSHRIILERGADPGDLAERVGHPLHGALDPAYVGATGAAGMLGSGGPRDQAVEQNLMAGVRNMRQLQQKPENRGMTNWGDFTADEGAAYLGYYNHEYDPDTSIMQYVLHSGDTGPLDDALDMAHQFADNCVNLEGQVYQHRSTTYAITGIVGDAAGSALIEAWRRGSNGPAGDDRIVKAMDKLYPASKDTKGRAHKLTLRVLKGAGERKTASPAAHERLVANSLGYFLAQASVQEYKRGGKAVRSRLKKFAQAAGGRRGGKMAEGQFNTEQEENEGSPGKPGKGQIRPWDLALVQRAGVAMSPLDRFMPASIDDIFAPAFTRYGGGWGDFPSFHFYDTPDIEETHSGSHTLSEMLVWGYMLTGDPHLRDMGLRIARDFAADGGLVDRTIAVTVGMNRDKDMVHIRTAGWTLINLLTLEKLTAGFEPDLHKALEAKRDKLVGVILDVPPRKYEGIIHAGVVTEALSRFHHDHQKDRSELAGRALAMVIDVGEFFTGNQWAASQSRFYYRQDNHSKTLKAGSYLMMLGLAYGGTHADDPATRDRLLGCARSMLTSLSKPATTSKALGMTFRCTFRALAVLQDDGARTRGR